MMKNDAQIKAKKFLKKYSLKTVTLNSIKNAIEKQGYTIIEFNSVLNDEDTATLITALGIEKNIEQTKGFTYVDQYRRLIFLNEDLSDEEKTIILAHEEGHIFCNHFIGFPILGKDVMEEYEANEFSHYILKPTFWQKYKTLAIQSKKIFIVLLAVCLITIFSIGIIYGIQKEKNYFGQYYLTLTGEKYHRKECIFVKEKTNIKRMTVDEFESGNYQPCEICIPNE